MIEYILSFRIHHRMEAYTNALKILDDAIVAFYANTVKAGVPLFGLGSKMNLGYSRRLECDGKFFYRVSGEI